MPHIHANFRSRHVCAVLLGVTMATVLVAGCTKPQQTTHPTSTTAPELAFPAGQYTSIQTYNDAITIAYSIQGDLIAIGIKARTAGWVAIALGTAHGDSDVIIGFVANGQITLQDTNHASKAGLHLLDTSVGGTDDLSIVGGGETNGITTLEFRRKLSTGDIYDIAFVKGNNNITWALGPTDAITSHHSRIGFGTITIP